MSRLKRIKVGVIGVGHLGKEHARIYAAMKEAELVGVVDTDPVVARRIARKHHTQWSADLDLLLDSAEAVSVAVPTVHHRAIALPFLQRGISVLVEKPMTYSVREAEELVAVAAENNAKLQVGHIERFNPGFKAIAAHNLKPLFVECDRLSPFPFRSTDVGVVFDLMIHDLDIVHTLVQSEIKRIEAVGVQVISPQEDIANARIVFENGCVANLTASRISLKPMRKIRVFAADCYATIDTGKQKAVVYRKKPGFDEVAKRLRGASAVKSLLAKGKLIYSDLVEIENVRLDEKEPLRAELESFVACVREDRAPEVPGEDGVKAVRVAEAVVNEIHKNIQAHAELTR